MNSMEHNPSSLAAVCTDTLALSEGDGGQQLGGRGQWGAIWWGAKGALFTSAVSFQIAHPPLPVPISSLLCPHQPRQPHSGPWL